MNEKNRQNKKTKPNQIILNGKKNQWQSLSYHLRMKKGNHEYRNL